MKRHLRFIGILLIMATGTVGFLGYAVATNIHGKLRAARLRAATEDVTTYSDAVLRYLLDHNNRCPRSLNDLVGGQRQYVARMKNDPWDNPYHFAATESHYRVWSSGPDGKVETADDVFSEHERVAR